MAKPSCQINVLLTSYSREELARRQAQDLSLPVVEAFDCHDVIDVIKRRNKQSKGNVGEAVYYWVFDADAIYLIRGDGKERTIVDFTAGGQAHRRKFGGGKGQSIAKAVGLNKGVTPSILDCTAGLGGDAFVLASLGCRLRLIERSPIAHSLLSDGLMRGQVWAQENDGDLLDIIERIDLLTGDSLSLLACANTIAADVVYLDPMFPERKKNALVKKEMRAFHDVIGADDDADELLDLALHKANYRVVVKRPRIAPFLADREPNYQLVGKSSRYDIYTLKAFLST